MPEDPYMTDRFGGTSLCAIRQAPRQHCEMEIVADLADAVMAAEAKIEALEAGAKDLRWLEAEGHTLRSENVPTGGDDSDLRWCVVAHYMREPRERTIAYGRTISEAIHLARTEPLEVGPA
jgi:hypothetical protein